MPVKQGQRSSHRLNHLYGGFFFAEDYWQLFSLHIDNNLRLYITYFSFSLPYCNIVMLINCKLYIWSPVQFILIFFKVQEQISMAHDKITVIVYFFFFFKGGGHGQVAQLVRVSSPYAKVASLIPSQDTYKKQQMNA